jgi:ferredoxin
VDKEHFPNMLYIHPEECIDCGACEPECPWQAIFEEPAVPNVFKDDIELNHKTLELVDQFKIKNFLTTEHPTPEQIAANKVKWGWRKADRRSLRLASKSCCNRTQAVAPCRALQAATWPRPRLPPSTPLERERRFKDDGVRSLASLSRYSAGPLSLVKETRLTLSMNAVAIFSI